MARRPVPRKTALYRSLAAPVGGWNARDQLSAMAPLDAVILDNWIPTTTGVMLRKGFTSWATGIVGEVVTLMQYASGTSSKMFGVAGSSVYDVTSQGAVGAAAVTGLTNPYMQSVNITTAGGSFLIAVNGADTPIIYNGTSWSTASITGATSSRFAQVNLFKNRLWFVEKDSLKAWYLGTDAISGAANEFNLQSVASQGGYLMAMATWTIDAGEGVDDYAVFITSQGEVIVYIGTDPSSVNTWALKGVWQVGAPLGRRCFQKYAGDLLLVCFDGLLPMSSALQSSRVSPKVAVTDKIQGAMSEASSLYPDNQGWQIDYCPRDSRLMINVPVALGAQQQFAMNTIKGAWGRFTGIPASCWCQFDNYSFFGSTGAVYRFWDGPTDNGTAVTGSALQAFYDFGGPALTKRWTMAQLLFQATGIPSVRTNINVDYDMTLDTYTVAFDPSTYGIWDVSLWDSGIWSPSSGGFTAWCGLSGVGKVAGLRLSCTNSTAEVMWQATNYTLEAGEFL